MSTTANTPTGQGQETGPGQMNGLGKVVVPERGTRNRFRSVDLIDIYLYTKAGLTARQVAKQLGYKWENFKQWCERANPAVIEVMKRARKEMNSNTWTFHDYVYGQLPPHLKEIWDKIDFWRDNEDYAAKIDTIIASQGKEVKMALWMHAYVDTNFNATEACRLLKMTKRNLDAWKEDPEFHQVFGQITWWKGNFFEQGLNDLVRMRVPAAVIFANRTFNKNRGYSEKLEVEMSGTVKHEVSVDIEALELPLEVRQVLLDAMRVYEKKQEKVVTPLQVVPQLEAPREDVAI